MEVDWLKTVLFIALAIVALILILRCFRTIPQASAGVVTVFGKYRRVMRAGLNFKAPWEAIYEEVSLQNRALNIKFQAITKDQANIGFETMVLYSVASEDEATIQRASFAFEYDKEFQLAMNRTIESSIRQYVATMEQSNLLGARSEIVEHTKANIDKIVLSWGYVVHDIQITDMAFDEAITQSMARVVASKNMLAAASNEGAALLIKRTKDAEAEAAFKTIGAEAEKKAAALRGEGLALFRKNVAHGIHESVDELKSAGIDTNQFLLSLEYLDALRFVSEHAKGKVIFMDNGPGAASRMTRSLLGADAASGE